MGHFFSGILGQLFSGANTSLDHLVFVLSEAHSGKLGQDQANDTMFPIVGRGDPTVAATDFQNHAGKKLRFVSSDACAIIERFQPYKSEKGFLTDKSYRGDLLWQLDKLAKMDRHRSLRLVSSTPSTLILRNEWSRNYLETGGSEFFYHPFAIVDRDTVVARLPMRPIRPIPPGPRTEMDVQLILEVTLKEHGIAPGLRDPVIAVLDDMSRYIESTVFPPLEALLDRAAPPPTTPLP